MAYKDILKRIASNPVFMASLIGFSVLQWHDAGLLAIPSSTAVGVVLWLCSQPFEYALRRLWQRRGETLPKGAFLVLPAGLLVFCIAIGQGKTAVVFSAALLAIMAGPLLILWGVRFWKARTPNRG